MHVSKWQGYTAPSDGPSLMRGDPQLGLTRNINIDSVNLSAIHVELCKIVDILRCSHASIFATAERANDGITAGVEL